MIDELHGYKPILLKEKVAKKQITIIEVKNKITWKIKEPDGGNGWADAVIKTKHKCYNCGKDIIMMYVTSSRPVCSLID